MNTNELLPILGGAGMGAMWGWQAGRLKGRGAFFWVLLSAVLLAFECFWAAGFPSAAGFTGGLLVAVWLHRAWLESLSHQAEASL